MNTGLEIFKRMQRLQGGTDEVQSDEYGPGWQLRRALHSAGQYIPEGAKWLGNEIRQGIVPDEALNEIQRDPTSMRSAMAYGEGLLGIGTLLSGGEGAKMPKMPRIGKTGMPIMPETVPSTPKAKSFQELSMREQEQLARDAGIPPLSEMAKNFKIRKADESSYDVFHNGEPAGTIVKGFSRLGGEGWTIGGSGKSHASLDDATRVMADRTRQNLIKQAHESTQTQPDAVPTIPTGETGPAETFEPTERAAPQASGKIPPAPRRVGDFAEYHGVRVERTPRGEYKITGMGTGWKYKQSWKEAIETIDKYRNRPSETSEEPPLGYVRGTSVVRGYPPTHAFNNC